MRDDDVEDEQLDFRILGPLEASANGDVVDIRGTKQRSLLAILLINANRVVSTDRVIDALWGDAVPATAENAVQVNVSALRRAFRAAGDGGDVLVTRRPGYVLRVDDECIDARRFERLVGDGSRALRAGDHPQAADLLRGGLALWRGEPLEEFTYEAFARAEIDRLHELRLTALEDRLEADLALGQLGAILAEIDALVARFPLRERLREQQMLALYRMGRQTEALETFRDIRDRLADELGIDPSPALQRLESAILQQDPSLELPPSVVPSATELDGGSGGGRATASEPDEDQAAGDGAHDVATVADIGAAPPARWTARDERKTVSVLFCDLVDSTGFASSADPEDVWERLRRYHAVVRDEITKYGGMLEKFIGDGVPGFFGAPTTHDNDPERAIRAALRIVDAIDDLNEAIDGPSLVVRIGITTGVVLVAGAPASGEGIVFGDAVNTAARLQSAATPGTIIVDEATNAATREQFEYESLPPVDLPGKPGPTVVYRALRPSSRPVVDRTGDYTTSFVGRDAELSLMKAAFSRAVRGDGMQLISIGGESGIGKTRLVWELFRFVDNSPDLLVKWRRGRCPQYGDGIAFWALGEIVKAEAGIFETDDIDTTESKLLRVLPEAQDRDWLYQRMLPLLGIGSDAAAEREELFAAWRRFLENIASDGPTVLVFEDIHWADEAMLAFLEDLIDRADPVPLVIVATARPELVDRLPSWANAARNAIRINVGPLNDAETDELVTGLLRQFNEAEEVAGEIVELSGGNPLHAEEYVRLLHDQSALGGEADSRVGAARVLPATISALIAARLDTLTPGRKQLLADAAVVGEVFWSGTLAFMARAPRADTEVALRDLSRRDLVVKVPSTSMSGEPEYRFRHALIRDVAYDQIPRAPRAERHLAVARWIESVAPERLEDLAEILASHYEQALALFRLLRDGRADQVQVSALRYLIMAGERAASLDLGRAEDYYRRAKSLAEPGSVQHADLLAHLAQVAQMARANLTESGQLYEQAIDALQAIGEPQRAAILEIRLVVVLDNLGERDRALRMLEDLIERLEADGPTPALARACAERAFPSWGDSIPEAVRYAERALALAEELDLPDVRATALGFRGASLVVMGDKRGLADERKAIATAIDGSLTSNVYTNYANLVMGMSYEAPMGALDIADEGLAFVRSRGMSDGETMIRVVRLEALYQSGRWDELLSESEALRESTRQQGDRWGLIGASFPMAWVLSVTGRAEAALELYESLKLEKHESEVAMDFAGPRARALRERGDVAQAAYVLEQVISRREAEQLPLRESLPHVIREAVALGRRDLLARCGLLCIGDVALSRHGLTTVQALIAEMDGEFVEAERAFSFAEAGWEEMGNPFERALALLGRGRCLYALRRSSARSYLSAATAALKSLGASLPVLAGNTTSQRRLD